MVDSRWGVFNAGEKLCADKKRDATNMVATKRLENMTVREARETVETLLKHQLANYCLLHNGSNETLLAPTLHPSYVYNVKNDASRNVR